MEKKLSWIKLSLICGVFICQAIAQEDAIIQEPTERLNYRRVDIALNQAEELDQFDVNSSGLVVAAPAPYSSKAPCVSIIGVDSRRINKICIPETDEEVQIERVFINDSGDIAGGLSSYSGGNSIRKIFRLINGGSLEIFSSPNTTQFKDIFIKEIKNDGLIIGHLHDNYPGYNRELTTSDKAVSYVLTKEGFFEYINDSSSLSNTAYNYSNGNLFGQTLQVRSGGIGVRIVPWIYNLNTHNKTTPTELEEFGYYEGGDYKGFSIRNMSTSGEYMLDDSILLSQDYKLIDVKALRFDNYSRKMTKQTTLQLYSLSESGYKTWRGYAQDSYAHPDDILIHKGNAISKSLSCGMPNKVTGNISWIETTDQGVVLLKDNYKNSVSVFFPSEEDYLPNNCLYTKIKLKGITAKYFKQSYVCSPTIKQRKTSKDLTGSRMKATIVVMDNGGKGVSGVKVQYDAADDGRKFIQTSITNKKGEAEVEFGLKDNSDTCQIGYFSIRKHGYQPQDIPVLKQGGFCTTCDDV